MNYRYYYYYYYHCLLADCVCWKQGMAAQKHEVMTAAYMELCIAEDQEEVSLDPEDAVLQALQPLTALKDAFQVHTEGAHTFPEAFCRVYQRLAACIAAAVILLQGLQLPQQHGEGVQEGQLSDGHPQGHPLCSCLHGICINLVSQRLANCIGGNVSMESIWYPGSYLAHSGTDQNARLQGMVHVGAVAKRGFSLGSCVVQTRKRSTCSE